MMAATSSWQFMDVLRQLPASPRQMCLLYVLLMSRGGGSETLLKTLFLTFSEELFTTLQKYESM